MYCKLLAGTFGFSILLLSAATLGQTSTTHSISSPDTSAKKEAVTRVTGIGGIFIKAKDPVTLRDWYKRHLGIDVQVWGGTSFRWVDSSGNPTPGTTAWMVGTGQNFAPSSAPFMVNYRVADLHAILAALREEGCDVLPKTEESEYGKFGWVMDTEGNKVELWQPPTGK
jgi:predicted enzyme related to lactoylglutathione lyase